MIFEVLENTTKTLFFLGGGCMLKAPFYHKVSDFSLGALLKF